MRKAITFTKIINDVEYTLGEVDYPKINKGDLFYSGGIYKCISRQGDMIHHYINGIYAASQNTLCRKIIKKT